MTVAKRAWEWLRHNALPIYAGLAVAYMLIPIAIIAVFYGDPVHPAQPQFLALTLLGMAAVYGLRRLGVRAWLPYIALGGPLAWSGLVLAHLHPALALVFIVPFMPAPRRDIALFVDEDEVDRMGEALAREVTAIELIAARQAWWLRGDAPAQGLRAVAGALGALVPPVVEDRPLGDDVSRVVELLGPRRGARRDGPLRSPAARTT